MAVNDFDTTSGFFIGVQYWILNKAEMLSGCTVPTPCPQGRNIDAVTNVVTPGNNHWAIRPAQHLSTTPTAYMAENCLTVTPAVLTNPCPTAAAASEGIHAFAIHRRQSAPPPGLPTH